MTTALILVAIVLVVVLVVAWIIPGILLVKNDIDDEY